MSRQFQGYLFALAAAASFGTLAISGKYAYADGVGVNTLMALRFGCAAAGFIAVIFFTKRTQGLAQLRNLGIKNWLRLLALGGAILASEVTLFFLGLKAPGMNAGLAETIFFIYPAWVVLLATAVFRQRVSVLVMACVVLAVAGVALTAGTLQSQSAAGVGYLLSASVLYAIYVALSGRWISNIEPLIATTIMMSGAAVALIAVAFVRQEPGPSSSAGWWAVASAVVFGTFLAYAFMYASLHRAPAAMVAVLTTAEPVVAVALGAMLLGERMTGWQALGSALILGSVLTLLASGYREQRRESGS